MQRERGKNKEPGTGVEIRTAALRSVASVCMASAVTTATCDAHVNHFSLLFFLKLEISSIEKQLKQRMRLCSNFSAGPKSTEEVKIL